ncbi:MAG: hypothetical protein AB7J32_13440 [Pseudonocardia sp.]
MTDDTGTGFPDRRHIDLARDPEPGVPNHAAEEGAPLHPLIDLSRDPTPGVPDHALPEEHDPDEDLEDPDEFADR